MKAPAIEPGLLQAFRWYAGVRLAAALVLLTLRLLRIEPVQFRLLYPGLIEALFLLGYLSWPWLARQLGRWYLPVALVVASTVPILNHIANVRARLLMDMPANIATADAVLWALALFIPLVLLAWQYDMRSVVAFCLGTMALEAVLMLGLGADPAAFPAAWSLIILRTFIYLLVGYLIVRLMSVQRVQRQMLERANAQLARFAATIEQLALSRERNRLARDLHDTLAHSLSAVAVQLEGADAQWDENPAAARALQEQALATTRQGLAEARRAIQSLRASPLEDLGLRLALAELAETAAQRGQLQVRLDLTTQLGGLDPATEQGIYRIAGEALANVVQHARASHLVVALQRSDNRLTLTVADDGQGFDPAGPASNRRYGIQGMRERSELIGGAVLIESRPGQGTTVRLTVEAAS